VIAAVPCAFLGRRERGFTMTELIAVMLIAAILAVGATSVLGRRGFESTAFADEVRAQLAYGQKVAVAARRAVTVTVAGNSVALTMCANAACSSQIAVPSPQGQASFVRAAPSGVTIGPDSTFSFSALGDTNLAANLTLAVAGDAVRNIVIEATTGYVRP
jgi:prepilin-type N-terminal cleavage/methylation domain-containing protein